MVNPIPKKLAHAGSPGQKPGTNSSESQQLGLQVVILPRSPIWCLVVLSLEVLVKVEWPEECPRPKQCGLKVVFAHSQYMALSQGPYGSPSRKPDGVVVPARDLMVAAAEEKLSPRQTSGPSMAHQATHSRSRLPINHRHHLLKKNHLGQHHQRMSGV